MLIKSLIMKPRSKKQRRKNEIIRKNKEKKLEKILQATFRRIQKTNPSFSEDVVTYLTIEEVKKNQLKSKKRTPVQKMKDELFSKNNNKIPILESENKQINYNDNYSFCSDKMKNKKSNNKKNKLNQKKQINKKTVEVKNIPENGIENTGINKEDKYTECSICAVVLKSKNLDKHMNKKHNSKNRTVKKTVELKNIPENGIKNSGINKEDKYTECSICAVVLKSKNLDKHMKKKHNSKNRTVKKTNRIELISKRGTVIKGNHSCSSCYSVVFNPTRYAKSNKGIVILCASCKNKIRSYCFPPEKTDALDYATTGGSFEGNRRKH